MQYDLLVCCGGNLRRCLLPSLMDANHAVFAPSERTALKKDLRINFTVTGGDWFAAEGEYEVLPCAVEPGAVLPGTGSIPSGTPLLPDTEVKLNARGVSVELRMRVLDELVTKYVKYDLQKSEMIRMIFEDGKLRVEECAESDSNVAEDSNIVAVFTILKNILTPGEKSKIPVYLNGSAINSAQAVKPMDGVYISGVHFIFTGETLAVNHAVECSLPMVGNKTLVDIPSPDNPLPAKPLSAKPPTESSGRIPKTIDFQRSIQLRMTIMPERETIDTPPSPKAPRPTPFILQAGASLSMFLVMFISLAVRVGLGASNPLMTAVSFISIVGSLAGMVVFPLGLRRFQAAKARREEDERRDAYGKYISGKDKQLAEHMEKDRRLLDKRFPSPQNMLQVARGPMRELWGRAPVYQEFLDIRVGKGDRPSLHTAQISDEGFVVIKDPCRRAADEMVRKYEFTSNAPVSVELMKNPVVGVYGHRETCIELLHSMLLQITALHSYDDVKIILLYDGESDFISFARWLPHMWNRERNFRFAAGSKRELDDILERLKPVFDEREEKKEKQKGFEEVFIPHFIVLSLSPGLLKNEQLHRRFLSSYDDLFGMGISFIIADRGLSGMPLLSNVLIECGAGTAYLYQNDGKSRHAPQFIPDTAAFADWPSLARHLFRVRTMDISENSMLPQSLSFLGMYGAKTVEELNIRHRWRQNDATRSISAPLGVTSSNLFNLDIHEKGHGPHGLLSGTTGSGKSELIQTLILSLCVNYSPDDIAFVIIDYKGGSTANIFKNLPHLAGSITNLGGNQIQRSLMSIKSELNKRQSLLESCGDPTVNNIDKYNALRKKNKFLPPMPHLILVADEFAELKKQQPVFMEEIISTSRIGRSLGVHLLLATQKPSGVVNDQIWSNTRFRICLKVADKNDSQEMLKHPDAAEITQAGRAYVQVGNDEIYQQVQTGYSGAPYFTGKDAGREIGGILYITRSGQPDLNLSVREKVEEEKEHRPQLEMLVNHIIEVADRDMASPYEGAFQPYRLWEDPLPEELYMEDLQKRMDWQKSLRWMAPVVGLADDVKHQTQPLLRLDFAREGSLIVYGIKGAGKTTLLQTLVYAMATQYTPEEAHLYIVDYDVGAMLHCAQLPHVGGVILPGDLQRLKSLFIHLEKEAAARKKLLASLGYTDMRGYIDEGGKTAAIVVMIHGFEAFNEEHNEYGEQVRVLIRDSSKFGIFFVLTGSTKASVHSSITRHVKFFICLQMLEMLDYKIILNVKDDTKPEAVSGRGLISQDYVMEFHTALALKAGSDNQRSNALRKIYADTRRAWTGPAAPVLAEIPNPYILQLSLESEEYRDPLEGGCLPLGYDMASSSLISLSMADVNVFPVIGGRKTGKTNFLKCLMLLCKKVPKTAVYVFDSSERQLKKTADELKLSQRYAGEKTEIITLGEELKAMGISRRDTYKKEPQFKFSPIVVFIDDAVSFFERASEEAVMTVSGLMNVGITYGVYFFVTGQNVNVLKGQTKMFEYMFKYENGLLMGGNLETYSYFNAQMPYTQRTMQYPEGMGYIFNKGKYAVIKTPKYGDVT